MNGQTRIRDFFVLIAALGASLCTVAQPVHAFSSIRTPEVRLGLQDANTGQPIANALVSVEWNKEELMSLSEEVSAFSHFMGWTDPQADYGVSDARCKIE